MMKFLVAFLVVQGFRIDFNRIPSTNAPPSKRLVQQVAYNSNSIYVIGGLDKTGNFLNDIWKFDLEKLLWEEQIPISSEQFPERSYGCGFALGQNVCIFAGNTSKGPVNEILCFDTIQMTWSIKQSFGDMPVPCISHQCLAHGNYLYVMTGIDTNVNNRLYSLDLETLEWKLLSYMSEFKFNKWIIIAMGSNKIFKIGYQKEEQLDIWFDQIFEFDLNTLSWSIITINNGTIPTSRTFTDYGIIDNWLFIMWGWSYEQNQYPNDIWKINLNNPIQWQKVQVQNPELLQTLQHDSGHFIPVNQHVYIFGGYYNNYLNQLIQIDLSQAYPEIVLLNDNNEAPKSRSFTTLNQISDKLYLFGGQRKDKQQFIYNDLWQFDTVDETWNFIMQQGDPPSPRYQHSSASEGDILIIYGGFNGEEVLSDMFIFNHKTKTWLKADYQGKIYPSGRLGACIVLKFPKVYIFGGWAMQNSFNDLWEFDLGTNSFTHLNKNIDLPTSLFQQCFVENDQFIVAFGRNEADSPTRRIVIYQFSSQSLKTLQFNDDDAFVSYNGANLKFKDKILTVGGERWGMLVENTIHLVDLNTSEVLWLNSLPENPYRIGFTYFQNNLYIFGGGKSIKEIGIPIQGITNNIMMKLTLADGFQCSPGTQQPNCIPCGLGTYNPDYDGNCIQCPAGKYQDQLAATSFLQCYPCPEGTFQDQMGSSYCKQCNYLKYCPIGSSKQINERYNWVSKQIQPKNYEENIDQVDDTIQNFNMYSIFIGIVIIVLILSVSKLRDKIQSLDIYNDVHNYQDDQVMILKKTFLGGIATLTFYFSALLIMVAGILYYEYDNVQESKSLVPLITLHDKAFKGDLIIIATFLNYGGVCSSNSSQCPSYFNIRIDSISSEKVEWQCEWVNEQDCNIQITCKQCQIERTANIQYNLQETASYCSGILVNVTSSSSIPNEISSQLVLTMPPSSKIFRGYQSTQLTFTMTPSVIFTQLFTSNIDSWVSFNTGYHVGYDDLSVQGTSYSHNEYFLHSISSSAYLKLQINLSKNNLGLVTKRDTKQTLYILLSSILGSIFGAMELYSFILVKVEENILSFQQRAKNKVIEQDKNEHVQYLRQMFQKPNEQLFFLEKCKSSRLFKASKTLFEID